MTWNNYDLDRYHTSCKDKLFYKNGYCFKIIQGFDLWFGEYVYQLVSVDTEENENWYTGEYHNTWKEAKQELEKL